MTETTKRPRGFAAMDRDAVRAIGRKGGKAAHAQGRAHEFTREEAKIAGKKGGAATREKLAKMRSSAPTETPIVDEKPAVG